MRSIGEMDGAGKEMPEELEDRGMRGDFTGGDFGRGAEAGRRLTFILTALRHSRAEMTGRACTENELGFYNPLFP
jgi:hypothetical protein